MKKTILIIALFIGIANFSNARSSGGELKYGPVIGLNLANISGDNSSGNAMKIGFNIGGVVEIPVSDNFYVAPGILYSMKGTQSDSASKYKFNLSYLEIPINAKYKLESGLNFFAGPYIGFLLAAKFTDGTTDIDEKDNVTSTDFGINIGIGFDMESGLGFSAQYGLGLSNINKSVSGVPTTPSNMNTNIGITVRYMLSSK